MSPIQMSLIQFYDDMSPTVRRWLFIALITITVMILTAWTRSFNKSLDTHLQQVNNNTNRITVLESRADSLRSESQSNYRKTERWMCFQDRNNAILAGMECPDR